MSQQPEEEPRRDPFSAWQSMRDSSIEAWTRMIRQFFTSEEYTRAASAALETYLITSAPFRQHLEGLMSEFVSSEAFGRATRAQLDAYLSTTEPFREMMLQFVESESFARITRELLDAYLTTSAPFREMMLQVVKSEAFAQTVQAQLDVYLATSTIYRDVMLQFVKSEAFAQSTRDLLDVYIATSATFREALQSTLVQAFTQFSNMANFDITRLPVSFDPTGVWRAMGDASIDAWSRWLAGDQFRTAVTATMGQVLTQLNMPSRNDISELTGRLDRLEQLMDEVVRLLEHDRGR